MRSITLIVAFVFISFGGCNLIFSQQASSSLPSWNNTGSAKAILNFVENVTTPNSPNFVPPAQRIAVFDNDGTLWAEQPNYFEAIFLYEQIKLQSPKHPEWSTQEPFASVLKDNIAQALNSTPDAYNILKMAIHAGISTDEFERVASNWISTATHPQSGKLFTQMCYKPMIELLVYLRNNGFKTFIVSGGNDEFMRTWTELTYGIPPEQVIGSNLKEQFVINNDTAAIMLLPQTDRECWSGGKAVAIQQVIGRRPIIAFGNSDGDLEMLQWTATGNGARLAVYIHHTDSIREWAYDRKSPIGKLDKGLDEAYSKGWIIVDMKEDWNKIFNYEK